MAKCKKKEQRTRRHELSQFDVRALIAIAVGVVLFLLVFGANVHHQVRYGYNGPFIDAVSAETKTKLAEEYARGVAPSCGFHGDELWVSANPMPIYRSQYGLPTSTYTPLMEWNGYLIRLIFQDTESKGRYILTGYSVLSDEWEWIRPINTQPSKSDLELWDTLLSAYKQAAQNIEAAK